MVTGVAGLALVASAVAATGTAAASPVDVTSSKGILVVCTPNLITTVNQNTWVRSNPGFVGSILYTIPSGGGFHILSGPYTGDSVKWWFGHGNGGANGYVPAANLSCTTP